MKKPATFIFLTVITAFSLLHLSAAKRIVSVAGLEGAWQLQNGDNQQVLLIKDGYFSITTFNTLQKRFVETHGGAISIDGNNAQVLTEFSTSDAGTIGTKRAVSVQSGANELKTGFDGATQTWTRIDDGSGALAGTWKITGRKQDGSIVKIHQTGPRKTLKILTGKRFQWIAINPETREFFGTGGGNYTFANGRYTENIEFFSRDSSRVGASLSFDGKVENGDWHHSGKSSRDDDIYEVWSRINQ